MRDPDSDPSGLSSAVGHAMQRTVFDEGSYTAVVLAASATPHLRHRPGYLSRICLPGGSAVVISGA
ncbi:hypothetical protein [Microbacterium sp. 22242]|uniref:hypothetical protein n=1 Tax=Microbacterium sp. 22242 TaxID=3453896 RepID=UPI003F86490B